MSNVERRLALLEGALFPSKQRQAELAGARDKLFSMLERYSARELGDPAGASIMSLVAHGHYEQALERTPGRKELTLRPIHAWEEYRGCSGLVSNKIA